MVCGSLSHIFTSKSGLASLKYIPVLKSQLISLKIQLGNFFKSFKGLRPVLEQWRTVLLKIFSESKRAEDRSPDSKDKEGKNLGPENRDIVSL